MMQQVAQASDMSSMGMKRRGDKGNMLIYSLPVKHGRTHIYDGEEYRTTGHFDWMLLSTFEKDKPLVQAILEAILSQPSVRFAAIIACGNIVVTLDHDNPSKQILLTLEKAIKKGAKKVRINIEIHNPNYLD